MEPVQGQLMKFYGKLVRVRGSRVLYNGQTGYDLDILFPDGVVSYGTAVLEELEPLVGTLPHLLLHLEAGHSVVYRPGGFVVNRGTDGSYMVLLSSPVVSSSVFFPASSCEAVCNLVDHLSALSPEWELR